MSIQLPDTSKAPFAIFATEDDAIQYTDAVPVWEPADLERFQLLVTRMVLGQLSAKHWDRVTLMSWRTPADVPTHIREAAGKLLASQLLIHYGQQLYRESLDQLNQP